jgi:putative ABC transport system ATP-binding protein
MMNSSPSLDSLPVVTEHLTKIFRQGAAEIRALDDLSLSVSKGEFVAVMGASGSGKSTLLHVLAGLTTADQGRVLIDGQDLAVMSDAQLTRFRRQRIGLVFQAFNLIPTLSAEDNIRLPAGRGPGTDERLEHLLAHLGIAARRHHRPDALSGGEQQRVAIARALITDPALVLADEPTGSLDSQAGQALCKLLRGLCDEEGRTIILVTHEPSVAAWARRIIVLKDGQQLTEFQSPAIGDTQAFIATYQEAVQQGANHLANAAAGGAS